MESQHAQRKNEHVSLAEKLFEPAHQQNPFSEVRLIHQSLPELAQHEITMATQLTKELPLSVPFYIEAMTGGSQQSLRINQQLAQIADQCGLAMACGSQSVALKHPDSVASFKVIRQVNPNGIVIANLSANATMAQIDTAIEMVDADAIELHVNATQEIVMPEGEREFYWLDQLNQAVSHARVPVIVKEVGFGMSRETISKLLEIGVQYVNVSGRGGTNFAMIENQRNHDHDFNFLTNWGLTTPESLLESQTFQPRIHVIASGGVTSALDVFKCGVLGASAVGVAGFFLHELISHGPKALVETIENWKVDLQQLMLLCGCKHFSDLRQVPYVLSGELYDYIKQRNQP